MTFFEYNGKEKDSFSFLLQYDGNEDALNQLYHLVEETRDVHLNQKGHYSKFYMRVEVNELSETTIEEFRRVRFPGFYADPVTICLGKFNPPFDEKDFELNDVEIAHKLDEWFFAVRIGDYFK